MAVNARQYCVSRVWLMLTLVGCGRIGFEEEVVRSTLRLDRVPLSEALIGFPLPVTLDETRADLTRLDPATLRFLTPDSGEVPHEIETLGPPVVAWVLVPTIIGTSTELIVEYGATREAPAPTDRVFGSDYAGVWHMADEGRLLDASVFARDGETIGTRSVRGLVGAARDYVPGDCAVVRGFAALQLPPSVTLSGWMWHRTARATDDFASALTRQKEDQLVDDFILGTTGMTFYGAVATNPTGTPTLTGTMTEIDAWHRVTYVYDGTMSFLYVDAALVGSGGGGGTPLASANPLFIGCGRNSPGPPSDVPDNDWNDGMLDELRIETVARSPAWLAYEHAAHRDQAISYGPVE